MSLAFHLHLLTAQAENRPPPTLGNVMIVRGQVRRHYLRDTQICHVLCICDFYISQVKQFNAN